MDAEILIRNLKKKYATGTEALKGIDLEIKKGQFFALLGPNGAGKSTLVKIITCLFSQDSGTFEIGGKSPQKQWKEIQHYIGIASQDNEIDPAEKVFAHLIFQCRLFGMSPKEATFRAEELLTGFALNTEKDKNAGSLSGGNKRRLHCALAMAHRPKVLFMDEPTVGMDPLARATFWNVINDLNKLEKTTIFLTTQYLEEADKYSDEMALIIDGTIHFSGSVSSFKNKVHPNENVSLEDSYISYVKSLNN